MFRFLRVALIALLAIGLPMQSYAAASQWMCQAAQEQHGLADAASAPDQAHDHHHPAAGDDAAGSTGQAGEHHACSVCGACAMTLAAAPTTPSLHAPVVAPTEHLPPPLGHASAPASRLERPPRPSLA